MKLSVTLEFCTSPSVSQLSFLNDKTFFVAHIAYTNTKFIFMAKHYHHLITHCCICNYSLKHTEDTFERTVYEFLRMKKKASHKGLQ